MEGLALGERRSTEGALWGRIVLRSRGNALQAEVVACKDSIPFNTKKLQGHKCMCTAFSCARNKSTMYLHNEAALIGMRGSKIAPQPVNLPLLSSWYLCEVEQRY